MSSSPPTLPVLNVLPARPVEALPAQGARAEFPIVGMTCAGCAAKIEQAVRNQPGVLGARVSFAAGQGTIQYDPTVIPEAALRTVVTGLGYTIPVVHAADLAAEGAALDDAERRERADLKRRLILSAALTLPIVIVAMSHGALPWSHAASGWFQLGLTLPVMLLGGGPIYRAAWRALRHGQSDMNVLVAAGTLAAFVASALAVLVPHASPLGGHAVEVYFEAAATIITLVLLGKWLEAGAKVRAGAALRELWTLQPRTARVLRSDAAVEVPIEQVRRDDRVQIRPGERFAVDGEVLEGTTTVDESWLTGESRPIDKTPGSRVLAGTLNGGGSVIYRATGIGRETLLQEIGALVRRAQGSPAPMGRLADRLAAMITPGLIGLAVLTGLGWWWFGPPKQAAALAWQTMISVLIIACPCALGLATPMAIVVATGRGARHGILFHEAAALEHTGRLQHLLLDKTGTLTEGRPALVGVQPEAGFTEAQVLAQAAAVESASEHPYARAVYAGARERGLAIPSATAVQALTGRGVRGLVGDAVVRIGTRRFLGEEGLPIPDAEPLPLASGAATVLHVALGTRYAGRLLVSDRLRPGIRAALDQLRARGLTLHLVTGDARPVAEQLAGELGITHVRAECLPGEKLAELQRLQAAGHAVGMVGDGVNDAPALAAADVGFALGTGTDVAQSAADVTLVRGDLGDLVAAYDLSRATRRVIRQNLAWAFGYNLIAIPIAAGLLYPWTGWLLSPMLASAAMTASSLTVVLNSLRLRRDVVTG